MRYYVIAGEASGDLHGSNLLKELKKSDASAEFRCWGGDLMQAAGGNIVKHYRELAFMGFVEVLMNIRTIFRNLAFCKKDIEQQQPDALILIDYPGFNLRIAEWAKEKGIPVIFYISPQVWAWKENRVKKMKQHIDQMLVILPFEKDYYQRRWNWTVEYVGHPLVQVIDEFNPPTPLDTGDNKPVIAILPGSRKQEILKKLPVMLEVSRFFPDHRFIVAKAPGMENQFYESMLAPFDNVGAVSNQTYALLKKSVAALVTSGTATLETALFGVPEVVCYKGNAISYSIAKRIINIKYISLVNLIMDRLVVKELIQHDMTAEKIRQELQLLLFDETKQAKLKSDYKELKSLLSLGGPASANAARLIIDFMQTVTSAKSPA
ncbi:MAG: lipid-A-disaccharide synthase [Chitinophagaceae bacterium]|nr:lipid-A-disaccharide synthase [Chitinophagaceae bacterium]